MLWAMNWATHSRALALALFVTGVAIIAYPGYGDESPEASARIRAASAGATAREGIKLGLITLVLMALIFGALLIYAVSRLAG